MNIRRPVSLVYGMAWWDTYLRMGVLDEPAPLWPERNDDVDRHQYVKKFITSFEKAAQTKIPSTVITRRHAKKNK